MPTQTFADQDVVIKSQPNGTTKTIYRSGWRRSKNWINSAPSWSTYQGVEPWQLPVNWYDDVQWKFPKSSCASQVVTDPLLNSPARTWWYGYGPSINDVFSGWALPAHTKATANLRSFVSLRNEAQIRLLNSAADLKANLPVTAAESLKTGRLLTQTATRLFHAYRNFRRGDFSGVARELHLPMSRVHQHWLEYRYGWMPLVMEVKGAAELLAESHFPRPPIFRVRKRASDVQEGREYTSNAYGWQGSGQAIVTETWASSKQVKVDVWFQVQNPQHSIAVQAGLTNPALVVWELVPFSFVFDWFIQVGDWLGALSAFHGLTVLRSFTHEQTNVVYDRTIVEPRRKVGNIEYSGFTTEDSMTYRAYLRDRHIVSTLDLYPPVSTDPFNWKRVSDGLALLRSSARRLETVRV